MYVSIGLAVLPIHLSTKSRTAQPAPLAMRQDEKKGRENQRGNEGRDGWKDPKSRLLRLNAREKKTDENAISTQCKPLFQ